MTKRFDDNELEIAIVTRGRGAVVRKFLEKHITMIYDMNACLTVHDSSADSQTKDVVDEYKSRGYKIRFFHYDYDLSISEKYLNTIIKSQAEYIWPIGDSYSLDFRQFTEKGYDLIKRRYDLLVVWNESVQDKECNDYTDADSLFGDCLWFMTWLGSEVYHRQMYHGIISKETLEDILYKESHGYGSWYPQLGLLYETLSRKKGILAKVVTVEMGTLASAEKNQHWVKEGYRTWCEDLCLWADSCQGLDIKVANRAIRETFERLSLDGNYWCGRCRVEEGLNRAIFDEYDKKGYIDRVSRHKLRIKIWAYMPRTCAKVLVLTRKRITDTVKYVLYKTGLRRIQA